MGSAKSLRTATLAVVALALALFVAFVAAGRGNAEFGDDRNDTLGYQEHFVCLAKGNDLRACNDLISTNFTEYVYPLFVAGIAKIAGPENFYSFKFIFALTVSFTIFFCCGLWSRVPSLTFMVLLLDFRFWEYVANSLRNGAALAVFLAVMSIYAARRRCPPFFARLLAGLTHSGALVLALAPSRKISVKTAVIVAALSVSVIVSASVWLPMVTGGALSTEKLAYYSLIIDEDASGSFLPIHYAVILAWMAYLYPRSRSQVFVYLCNILGVLLIFAGLLGTLNLAYRAVSIMLPFIAIGVTYPMASVLGEARHEQGNSLSELKTNHAAAFRFCAGYLVVLSFFGFALVRNFDAVRIHLS